MIHILNSVRYHLIKAKNRINRLNFSKGKNLHVFILCPPYCGSTLLHRIISSSDQVSSNNNFGTREGQQLPELKHKLFIKGRWEEDFKVDWPNAKKIWYKYWDIRKPILLEKSPAHLMRAEDIQKHFKPSAFIIMVRNPYAHAEGLMRRNGWDVERAGRFALKCLGKQKENSEILKNSLVIKYENLVVEKGNTIVLINKFLNISIDLSKVIPISENLNSKKVSALSDDNVVILTKIFKTHQKFFDYFKYVLI